MYNFGEIAAFYQKIISHLWFSQTNKYYFFPNNTWKNIKNVFWGLCLLVDKKINYTTGIRIPRFICFGLSKKNLKFTKNTKYWNKIFKTEIYLKFNFKNSNSSKKHFSENFNLNDPKYGPKILHYKKNFVNLKFLKI